MEDYYELIKKWEMCYWQVYQPQMKSCEQKVGENLQEFEVNMVHSVRFAYQIARETLWNSYISVYGWNRREGNATNFTAFSSYSSGIRSCKGSFWSIGSNTSNDRRTESCNCGEGNRRRRDW